MDVDLSHGPKMGFRVGGCPIRVRGAVIWGACVAHTAFASMHGLYNCPGSLRQGRQECIMYNSLITDYINKLNR